MLIIRIHNDGTGDRGIGNYNCEVLITRSPTELDLIASANIVGHLRDDGWKVLVYRLLLEAQPTRLDLHT